MRKQCRVLDREMQEESRREKWLVERALRALNLKLAVAKTGTRQILLVMDADTCKAIDAVVVEKMGRRLEDHYGVFLSWLKRTKVLVSCLEKPGHGTLEVPIENPFFGKEREEVEIELDLLGCS